MKVVSAKIQSYTANGDRVMDVVLVSDNTPSTLPTTGAGIDGLEATDRFAPLSVLFVVNGGAVYLANESGTFAAM